MKLSETQVRWFRLRRSGLVEPFASPEETASALVGVQAQILPAAGLVISLSAFSPLPRHVRAAVQRNATGVAQFFGLPLTDVVVDQDTRET